MQATRRSIVELSYVRNSCPCELNKVNLSDCRRTLSTCFQRPTMSMKARILRSMVVDLLAFGMGAWARNFIERFVHSIMCLRRSLSPLALHPFRSTWYGGTRLPLLAHSVRTTILSTIEGKTLSFCVCDVLTERRLRKLAWIASSLLATVAITPCSYVLSCTKEEVDPLPDPLNDTSSRVSLNIMIVTIAPDIG